MRQKHDSLHLISLFAGICKLRALRGTVWRRVTEDHIHRRPQWISSGCFSRHRKLDECTKLSRLRDLTSWLCLAVEASSRNLALVFFLIIKATEDGDSYPIRNTSTAISIEMVFGNTTTLPGVPTFEQPSYLRNLTLEHEVIAGMDWDMSGRTSQ